MNEWARSRAGDLAALCEYALSNERLTRDELESCCWDDPGAVLALPDDRGAVSVCVQPHGDRLVGSVKLIVAEPAAQGLGHGRALLAAAEAWAWDQGAVEVRAGEAVPFYLWPGIDVRMTRALCLFEAAGYVATSAAINMSCPTTHRAAPPSGIVLRRVIDDDARDATLAFVAAEWPGWVPEATRGVEHGSCFGAVDEGTGAIVGFACHSVNRAGWVGPMGTSPASQRRGVGKALLGELCKDLMVAGLTDAEISWVGPVGFYAKEAGAAVSRTFRAAVLRRPR